MKKYPLIFLLLPFVLIQSCSERKKNIALRSDYEAWLTRIPVSTDNSWHEEFTFWSNRLAKNPNDETSRAKLAGLYSEHFKSHGRVEDILQSDSLYSDLLASVPGGSVDLYHCLAANAITQHKFRLAKTYAENALALKDKKAASLLVLADVSLELGDVAAANRILHQLVNKNSFAYLIRLAKVKDHEGKLDTAIILMEKAYHRVRGNKATAQWTLSNLGDMYGHAGRIEEAYAAYLNVLKKDPQDSYALKGIAWIALSNDHNTTDAKYIIDALASRKFMPEAHLMLAEVATLNGDSTGRMLHLKTFKELTSVPEYKTMYHKYLAALEADEFGDPNACIAIAEQEIKNRPTPQSYDLLAWGYYHQGDFAKALAVASRYVVDQTNEPDAFYHLGMIFKANGKSAEAQHYLTAAKQSSFELGPTLSNRINDALRSL